MELPIFPEERSCRSCGYLARLIRYSGRVEELPELPRRDGVFIHAGSVEARREHADKPVCFRRVCDLSREWVETGRVAIERNRECPKWSAYYAGITPQELWADERMIDLEKDRRAWEVRMDAENKAADDRMRETQDRLDRRQFWFMVWTSIAAILIAVVGVAVAVLSVTEESIVLRAFLPAPTAQKSP